MVKEPKPTLKGCCSDSEKEEEQDGENKHIRS